MEVITIKLKEKHTIDEGLLRPKHKAGPSKGGSNKRCAVCGGTARKKAPRGYIHPGCRMHRKDSVIRVRPRKNGRYRI